MPPPPPKKKKKKKKPKVPPPKKKKKKNFPKFLTVVHVQHVHVVKMSLNVKQEYKSALRYTNRLLQIEPQNRQGRELQEKITAQMKKG